MIDVVEPSMVVKAFRVLEALAEDYREKTLSELASTAGVAKSTAHRLLKIMADLKYVERAGAGRYRLGQRLPQMVLRQKDERLLAAAKPALDRLHYLTQETVNFGQLQHTRVVYLAVRECTQPLRHVSTPNQSHPYYCTALGRAIAAFLPPDELEGLLAQTKLDRRTPRTVGSIKALREMLAQTRKQGYAIEKDETDLGAMCVGAPVFEGSRVVAALSASTPTARVTPDICRELIDSVRTSADGVTEILRLKERPNNDLARDSNAYPGTGPRIAL
jgi:DNA-binding IclR family transcriptional regulator